MCTTEGTIQQKLAKPYGVFLDSPIAGICLLG